MVLASRLRSVWGRGVMGWHPRTPMLYRSPRCVVFQPAEQLLEIEPFQHLGLWRLAAHRLQLASGSVPNAEMSESVLCRDHELHAT